MKEAAPRPGRFAVAWQFLTVIPLFPAGKLDDRDLARAMGAFPAVGLALGAGLVAFHLVLGRALPGLLEGAIAVALLAAATGCFHLDGLADTADGLSGGWTRERALEIMKDSRTGAVGAAALCLAVVALAAGYGLLPPGVRWAGFLVTPAAGRAAAVWLARRSPYARPEGGLGRPYSEHLTDGEVLQAALWAGAPAVVFLGVPGLLALAFTWVWAEGLRHYFLRRLGGVTGDVLGFCEVTSEIVFLVFLHALT
ncbi:adenosylcobinamide-GDP ribazoletransferase [Deferrisoma sp.]